MAESPRQQQLRRLESLKQEAASWRTHWRDLSEQIQPWRARFLASDRNSGMKRNSKIINSTPRRAARILSSGMQAGVTSPARPWFRLTTPDPETAQFGSVRAWLHLVEERIREYFARSNLYNCLHSVYVDLGTFGTAVLYVEEDEEDGIRGYVFPIGQYYLANSARLQVDTIYRELSMTVGQLVEKFGLEACSQRVQAWYQNNERQQWVEVVHSIGPNQKADGRPYGQNMPWKACWFEKNVGEQQSVGFLREAGYEDNPVMAPRWEVAGEDVYGTSPGMDALGDCKGLQQLEKRRLELVDLMARPPMKGPPNLRSASLVPGTYTAVSLKAGEQAYGPSLDINPNAIMVVRDAISDHEARINSSYLADLWMMLAQNDRDVTAREVVERHEEKMLQLGPTMERLQDELLDPLIDRVFNILLRAGHIPRPPQEIEGTVLKVEHLSVVSQAQKLLGTTGMERTTQFIIALAQAKPEVLDKLNGDEMVDSYADAVGLAPNLTHDDEAVARIRAARAKQQQAQEQGAAMLAAAEGAKNLAGAKLEDDNALSRLLGGVGAPPAPPGGAP